MTRFALALATSFALAAPVAADSLTLLLQNLIFPDDKLTTSTKGCVNVTTQPACKLAE